LQESAAAAAASGVVALPAAPASQPPPTTIFVQVGRHEWEDFPVSPGTLGLMRGGFIQLLLSRSTLAPLVNALPPPHEVFAVKRILSADRDFPEVDDEVADNLVKIDKRVTLGNAASQRHTGADLFILVRSSAYAGERPHCLGFLCFCVGLPIVCNSYFNGSSVSAYVQGFQLRLRRPLAALALALAMGHWQPQRVSSAAMRFPQCIVPRIAHYSIGFAARPCACRAYGIGSPRGARAAQRQGHALAH